MPKEKRIFKTKAGKAKLVAVIASEGKHVLEEYRHIIGYKEDRTPIYEQGFVVGDEPRVDEPSIEERVKALEARVALLEGP